MALKTEQMEVLRKRFINQTTALLSPKNNRSPLPAVMLEVGRRIRDTYTQYPHMGSAIHTYLDLAATREWTVTGQPRAATRAWDWLSNAESMNPDTGMVDYGFDSYLRRRGLDRLTIGATAFACRFEEDSPLEYIDPTGLRYVRNARNDSQGRILKAQKEELAWYYRNQWELRVGELFLQYAIPVGAGGFISPLLHVMPSALLAWLIRESDTASVDGRRIRDILFIADPALYDQVEEAVLTQLALWSQEGDIQDMGVPIIAVNGAQKPMKDMFARLGLSEIPTTLNRSDFNFSYVNELSGATGLALRQFWNDESTTNRALEDVQEQRQQQKGPAAFVRDEQRLINRSGLLKRFGNSAKLPTRFSFLEESDTSTMKARAEVLKLTADAFGVFFDRLGLSVKPESFVAWLQSIGQLPYELEFADPGQAPAGAAANSDPQATGNTSVQQIASDPQPTTMENLEKRLGDGEIVINQDGNIVTRFTKTFSLNMILDAELKSIRSEMDYLIEVSAEDYLAEIFKESKNEIRLQFEDILRYDADSLYKWQDDQVFESLVNKVSNMIETIDEDESLLMSKIVLAYGQQTANFNSHGEYDKR